MHIFRSYLQLIVPVHVKEKPSSHLYTLVCIFWKNGSFDRNSFALTGIGAAESCPRSQQYCLQAPPCNSILYKRIMQVILQFPRLSLAQAALANEIFLTQGVSSRSGRAAALQVQNFKFLKEMGLKKPGFLPDFGKVGSKSNCRVIITRRCMVLYLSNELSKLSHCFAGEEEGCAGQILHKL